ncbi:unnamed protein product [Heterosigma akashiwo]|mmetsp:Transcript_9401/g.14783  ORF Transcript_9401/g.14783 Transcript_9401/m.14783 type:complete len:282 (-) Transcript_9401:437-1282(-)
MWCICIPEGVICAVIGQKRLVAVLHYRVLYALTSRRHLVTHETKVFSDLRDSKTSWNFFRGCQYSCTFWYYKVAQFNSATMAMGHKTSAAICTSSESHKRHIGHTPVGSWTIETALVAGAILARAVLTRRVHTTAVLTKVKVLSRTMHIRAVFLPGAVLARAALAVLSRAVLTRTVRTRAVLPKATVLVRTTHARAMLALEWCLGTTIHDSKQYWRSHHHFLQTLGIASAVVFFTLTKAYNLSWEDLVPVPVVSARNTKRPNKASATDTLWSYFQNAQHRV